MATIQSYKNNNREIKYDWLRSCASFAIVLVHAIPPEPQTSLQWWFHSASTPVLLSFVGIYFMLSGVFQLQASPPSLTEYYQKRLLSIGIPLLCYSFVYLLYNQAINPPAATGRYWLDAVKDLVNGTVPYASHLWFMYPLAALYLVAPFLAAMLGCLSDRRLQALIWAVGISQALVTYGPLAGIYPPQMLFTGWTFYFLLGYSLKRLYTPQQYPAFAVLAVLSLGVTLIQKKVFPEYTPNIHDLAPTMILIASAIFLFFEFYANTTFNRLNKIIHIIGKYSYSIYLIHFLILQHFVKPIISRTPLRHYYLLEILVSTSITFLMSFFFCLIFDYLTVLPLKRALSFGRSQRPR